MGEDDFATAVAVVTRAQAMSAKQRKAEIEAVVHGISVGVANRLAPIIAKMIR